MNLACFLNAPIFLQEGGKINHITTLITEIARQALGSPTNGTG